MVYLVNSHTNATSKTWHLWLIIFRFAPTSTRAARCAAHLPTLAVRPRPQENATPFIVSGSVFRFEDLGLRAGRFKAETWGGRYKVTWKRFVPYETAHKKVHPLRTLPKAYA